MLSTVLYYELAMKVPIPVGITVYLLTWGLVLILLCATRMIIVTLVKELPVQGRATYLAFCELCPA